MSKFKFLVLISVVTLFAACAKEAAKSKGAGPAGGVSAPGGQPVGTQGSNPPGGSGNLNPSTPGGTGDGGGGNSIDGKPIDSYAFDITKNELWIKYFSATFSDSKNLANENMWKALWKSRVWYMVPITLKTLPKERIGAELLEQPLSQVAIHTNSREIWIDKTEFANLKSDEERATLLLHEFIMGLTTIGLSSPRSICVDYAEALHTDIKSCSSLSDKGFNGTSTAYPASKLTNEHYAHIRNATKELFDKILKSKDYKLSAQELLLFYFKNNFSSQFFSDLISQETISEERLELISRRMISGAPEFLPICHVKMKDNTTRKITCKSKLEKRKLADGKQDNFLVIEAEVDGKKKVLAIPTRVISGILFNNEIRQGLAWSELEAAHAAGEDEVAAKAASQLYTVFFNGAVGNITIQINRPLEDVGVSFAISNQEDPELAKKPAPGQYDNVWPGSENSEK